ncbi:MAG: HlyD family efflux transporter periplasmic adaptor subunit [Gemmatimonadetes bacterium]|nr:HlyD family efflux transporter periplasmic adaptor subunit [Gemmatimonadota bacterium]
MDIPREPPKKTKRYVLMGVAALVLIVVTVALASLKPAAPTVESPWTDKVKRGPMVRQVRGPGTLVPEEIHWISAVTQGRVERVMVQPGETVKPGTILLELSNPDEQLQALDAERGLTAAEATLVQLRTNLETSRLAQQAAVATARSAYLEAKRQLDVAMELSRQNMIAPQDMDRARDNEQSAKTHLEVAEEQLKLQTEATGSQIAAQQAQVEGQRRLVEMRHQRIASMAVRAGSDGVVQDLTLQPGQWVMSGMTLAKVVQPSRLKAVLRVPETQAKDVAIGLKAEIDTRNGIVPGHVVRIDPSSQGGTVGVDVALEGTLPAGARPDLSVDGTIEIERLQNVLSVGRPAFGQSESMVTLFKLDPGGKTATRVQAKFGRSSVNTIEVLEGLNEGDEIIVSDVSRWDGFDRVRIK